MFKLMLVLFWPFRKIARIFILIYEHWPAAVPISRTPERQGQVESEARSLALYQMEACPYCVKVRKRLRSLGLSIELRNIKRDPAVAAELVEGGGRDQVPCLRITPPGGGSAMWMYESNNINEYLEQRFGSSIA